MIKIHKAKDYWRQPNSLRHNALNIQSNKQLKFIVPLNYSVNADLLVGILDDNRVYNTKFVDGRKAELIDGNTVNIRPWQPPLLDSIPLG